MKKRIVFLTIALSAALLSGCGEKENAQKPESLVETTAPSSDTEQPDSEQTNAELPDEIGRAHV